MQGKIFGIPLTVIVLVLAIVIPVLMGELVLARQIRELTRFTLQVSAENKALLYQASPTPTEEPATPSATPTTARVRVFVPTQVPAE